MILPDNNMKKYAKFVLGLILIVVIIKPIIKIFEKDFDFNSYLLKQQVIWNQVLHSLMLKSIKILTY